MSSSNGLLLVTKEAGTAEAVATALEKNGDFAATHVCQDLDQVVTRLGPKPAQAVLVDLDPDPQRTLSELEPIIARFAGTRFIVLSASRRDDLILEAMQIGARHFLVKQSILADLSGVLGRLIPGPADTAGREGAVITILSASGGCGATTLAVNLADELRLMMSARTLLVDLDCHYGAVASYFGLEGQFGLADVLANPGRIDAELIRSTAVPCTTGLHVLLSPVGAARFGEPATLEAAALSRAVEYCRCAYACSVLDAPRVPMDVAACLGRQSEVTLIVFQLSVKDIRRVRLMRDALLEGDVPAARIQVLANRYRKRHSMIGIKDAEKALGGVSFGRIRDGFRSAIGGLNYGQPLSQAAPRSGLRRDIRRLAGRLSEEYIRHPGAVTQR